MTEYFQAQVLPPITLLLTLYVETFQKRRWLYA